MKGLAAASGQPARARRSWPSWHSAICINLWQPVEIAVSIAPASRWPQGTAVEVCLVHVLNGELQ